MFKLLILSTLLACILVESIQTSPPEDGKIVGGNETTIEKYPYVVSVRFMSFHRCGASIFTFDTVLVAANCILGLSIEYITIVAGATKRSENGVERLVKEAIIHENFDAYYRQYDIALLILNKPYFYTPKVQSIIQPRPADTIRPGTRVYIAGWGGNIEGQNIQDNLHYTDLYTIDNEECARKYKKYFEITEQMVCAVPWVGVRGSCYGDFGGPLVIEGKVHGIILWPIGCGEKPFPSIFLKISAVRDWIKEQLVQRGMFKALKQIEL